MQAAAALPADALREAFNASFADYLLGAPKLQAQDWPDFLLRHGIDLGLSVVLAEDDQVRAFAMVCPISADRVRLATMGVRPGARGGGAAARLLDHVLAQARARGATCFELEVFAQNLPAVRLYQRHGFAPVAPLYGYERGPGSSGGDIAADAPHVVTPAQAASWLRAVQVDGIPYQVSAAAIESRTGPLVAWRLGHAQLVFRPRGPFRVSVLSLIDVETEQRGARALALALAAAHPQATLHVPQLQRLDLGGHALEAIGWARLPLHQLLMRRSLRD